MIFGLRIIRAGAIGALLSVISTFFLFGGQDPVLGSGLSELAWKGVARILIAILVLHVFAGIVVILQNTCDVFHPRWRKLGWPFLRLGGWIENIMNGPDVHPLYQLIVVLCMMAAAAAWTFLIVLPIGILLAIAIFKPTAFSFYLWWKMEAAHLSFNVSELPQFVSTLVAGKPLHSLLFIYFKGIVIPYLVFLTPYYLVKWKECVTEIPLFRRLFLIGKGGSSRFAGPWSYGRRACACSRSLFVGRTNYWDAGLEYGLDIGLNDAAHMLTIGCPGSGKSTTSIWIVLGTYCGGLVLLDPKAEHAKRTYMYRNGAWRVTGRCQYTKEHLPGAPEAHKLDPFSQDETIPSATYNFFSEIDVHSDRVLERLAAISDGCVLPEGDKNRHWTEGSRTILEGCMAHVLSTAAPKDRNLPYLHDLLLGFDPELGMSNPEKLASFLVDMRCNPVAGGICFKAANLIAQDMKGAMMTTVLRSIKWIGDPAMRKHLSEPSSFKFADVPNPHGTGNTVYIVAPLGPLMKEQVRWLRSLTNLSITIIRRAQKPRDRTIFLLDEFPQLQGSLTAVHEGIVTLREDHIRIWAYLQQIGQLKRDYASDWNTFINASNVQVFGVTDPETAEWLSKDMLGAARSKLSTEKLENTARPLLTPQEIMNEFGKNDPRQIIFPNDGGFPMRLERLAYKSLKIDGKAFRAFPGLHGRFEEPAD